MEQQSSIGWEPSPLEERDTKAMAQRLRGLTPEEYDRFEQLKRSKLKPAHVRRLVRDALPPGASVDDEAAVVVGSLAKQHVADLVREARARAPRRARGRLSQAAAPRRTACGG